MLPESQRACVPLNERSYRLTLCGMTSRERQWRLTRECEWKGKSGKELEKGAWKNPLSGVVRSNKNVLECETYSAGKYLSNCTLLLCIYPTLSAPSKIPISHSWPENRIHLITLTQGNVYKTSSTCDVWCEYSSKVNQTRSKVLGYIMEVMM